MGSVHYSEKEGQAVVEAMVTSEMLSTLELISGKEIEAELVEIARIGGTQLEPSAELSERYAVSRLALSKEDAQARVHLRSKMEAAGMVVKEHPLGLVGTYEGSNPSLPAIGMMSHYDSVPEAGMYDGTVGILSAIHIVSKLKEQGIKPEKSIKVIALTGEESARFNMALFGSKGMFLGLTDEELDMQDKNEISLRQALIDLGYNPEDVKKPFFKSEDFESVIEFHVAQDNRYPDKLSIIEAIAAPERYRLGIGRFNLEPIKHTKHDTFLSLTINGEAGHSGATPMGPEYRNDGLVMTSEIIERIIELNNSLTENKIAIGNCDIANEAMNKIPGKVKIPLCITGTNSKKIVSTIEALIQLQPEQYSLNIYSTQKPETTFYEINEMQDRQNRAVQVVQTVHEEANKCAKHKCVGTVSTFNTLVGKILLGIDLRGIDVTTRQIMIEKIKKRLRREANLRFREPLPGSGTPETMDHGLVKLAESLIQKLGIAPHVNTFSPAGHDIQNVSRALINTLLLFCPSPNGLSHNPKEYSSPEHIEWGAKALAALILQLM